MRIYKQECEALYEMMERANWHEYVPCANGSNEADTTCKGTGLQFLERTFQSAQQILPMRLTRHRKVVAE